MIALAVLLLGPGLVSAASEGPARSAAQLALRWCGALLLGLGATSLAFSAGQLALGLHGAQADVAAAALGAALLAASRGRGLRLERAERAAGRVYPELIAFTALAALLVAALFVEHSVRYPDGGWDATAIWNVRARALSRLPSRLDLAFAPEVPHPDYPPLLPALIAHGWRALGSETPALPAALHGLFAALAVAMAALAVATSRGAGAGLMAALLLLGTPALLQQSWSQAADVPLAALVVGAATFAHDRSFFLAGLCAGLGAFTKNEGALALAALLGATLLCQGPRAALRLLAGAAAPLAVLVFFKLRLAPPNDLAQATPAAALRERLTDPRRALDIARAYAGQLWSFEGWGVSLPAVAASWVALLARRARIAPEAQGPALFAALLALAHAAIYLAIPELAFHLAHSLDRLLMQLWPTLVVATLLALPAPVTSDLRAPAPAAG